MPDDTIEKQIGRRVQMARDGRNMTAQSLAQALDISYQQVRKYETGQNRISVSVLFRLAQILDIEIEYFFRGLEPETRDGSDATTNPGYVDDALKRVADADVRRKLCDLIEALERSQRR